jgi:hypothetical protein
VYSENRGKSLTVYAENAESIFVESIEAYMKNTEKWGFCGAQNILT